MRQLSFVLSALALTVSATGPVPHTPLEIEVSDELQAIALGGALAVLGPLVGYLAPAIASRIRYGRLPKPDDK